MDNGTPLYRLYVQGVGDREVQQYRDLLRQKRTQPPRTGIAQSRRVFLWDRHSVRSFSVGRCVFRLSIFFAGYYFSCGHFFSARRCLRVLYCGCGRPGAPLQISPGLRGDARFQKSS